MVEVKINFSTEEKSLMDLFSKGYSYEVIQEKMQDISDIDYSGKKLGYKMSELRRKAGCASLFQLGFRYNQQICEEKIVELAISHEKELKQESISQYGKGLQWGQEQAKILLADKSGKNDFALTAFGVSAFWLFVIMLILTFA